jgi:hypothetical protein
MCFAGNQARQPASFRKRHLARKRDFSSLRPPAAGRLLEMTGCHIFRHPGGIQRPATVGGRYKREASTSDLAKMGRSFAQDKAASHQNRLGTHLGWHANTFRGCEEGRCGAGSLGYNSARRKQPTDASQNKDALES